MKLIKRIENLIVMRPLAERWLAHLARLGQCWPRFIIIDILLMVFPLRVFHVNICVIAMCFKFVLFYFISLKIALNILIFSS